MGLNVCVYCGARSGHDARHAESARLLGTAIAARGGSLVYGGGRVGLMGVVADAAMAGGAQVVGVIPDALKRREVEHRAISELIVVDTMHERKQAMAERADVFVALPGGLGTLEELFEVWTWRQLGFHGKPMGMLNVAGYYDGLLAFVRQAVEQGFVTPDHEQMLIVDDAPARLLERLARAVPPAPSSSDYGHT